MRCAIYTRKSTEEGLNQEFNTLEAQREAAEAYIRSQRHTGWTALAERYDDGGYTGANLERPALRKLLADIEGGNIDCVLVYKVDRLSRSLLDFARLMEIFEGHKVSLVSITQPLNTTSSLGRLTLNILLSFAQFEREMIADRTRDKMAAARRKGKWVGGRPALGYDVAVGGGKLVVNPEEAGRVQAIYALYLQHRSLEALLAEIVARTVDDQALDHTGRQGASRAALHAGDIRTVAEECALRRSGIASGRRVCRGAGSYCRAGGLGTDECEAGQGTEKASRGGAVISSPGDGRPPDSCSAGADGTSAADHAIAGVGAEV